MYLFKEGNDKLLLSKNDISTPTMHSEMRSGRCMTVHEIVARDVAQAYEEGAFVDLLDEPAAVDGRTPESWGTTQVASWFQTIGCPGYKHLVQKENLNGKLLVLLEDQELKDFGIKNSFHRKKILLELSNVKSAAEKKRKRDSQSRPGPSGTAKKKKSAMGRKQIPNLSFFILKNNTTTNPFLSYYMQNEKMQKIQGRRRKRSPLPLFFFLSFFLSLLKKRKKKEKKKRSYH